MAFIGRLGQRGGVRIFSFEITFPVLDPELQAQLHEVLEIQLADTVTVRRILSDGRSVPRSVSTK